ncbi:MAG: hypothetical protein HC854_00220 [Flavobacterium sp.]|nr:hypothetical protein [Flavobacterium sp.]
MGISGLRLSLIAQNLYYITADGYRGVNIEARNRYNDPLIVGYQRGQYPIPRTILFGVEVNF